MGPQIKAFMGKSLEELAASGELGGEFFLQRLRDIHLHSDLIGEMEATSDVKYVYIFTAIALFILTTVTAVARWKNPDIFQKSKPLYVSAYFLSFALAIVLAFLGGVILYGF